MSEGSAAVSTRHSQKNAPVITLPASQQRVTEAHVVAGTCAKYCPQMTAFARRPHVTAAGRDMVTAADLPDPRIGSTDPVHHFFLEYFPQLHFRFALSGST